MLGHVEEYWETALFMSQVISERMREISIPTNAFQPYHPSFQDLAQNQIPIGYQTAPQFTDAEDEAERESVIGSGYIAFPLLPCLGQLLSNSAGTLKLYFSWSLLICSFVHWLLLLCNFCFIMLLPSFCLTTYFNWDLYVEEFQIYTCIWASDLHFQLPASELLVVQLLRINFYTQKVGSDHILQLKESCKIRAWGKLCLDGWTMDFQSQCPKSMVMGTHKESWNLSTCGISFRCKKSSSLY